MALTPKQERFAQCVADGMSQADAYRSAFDVGATTKAETVQKRASELMANGDVRGRVVEMQERLAEKAIWTREDSATVLAEIALGRDEQGKTSDRVAAVKELNAMHGFNAAIKTELTGPNGEPLQAIPALIQLVGPEAKE